MCRSQRKNGSGRLAQVLRQSLAGLQEGLLEHVGVVDAALELAVEAEVDHPLEPLAVARKQVVNRRLVSGGGELQEGRDFFGLVLHRDPPCCLPRTTPRFNVTPSTIYLSMPPQEPAEVRASEVEPNGGPDPAEGNLDSRRSTLLLPTKKWKLLR